MLFIISSGWLHFIQFRNFFDRKRKEIDDQEWTSPDGSLSVHVVWASLTTTASILAAYCSALNETLHADKIAAATTFKLIIHQYDYYCKTCFPTSKYLFNYRSYQLERGISDQHFGVEHLNLQPHACTPWLTRLQGTITEPSTRSSSETSSFSIFLTEKCVVYMIWWCYTYILALYLYKKVSLIRTRFSKQNRIFLSTWHCSSVNWYCLLKVHEALSIDRLPSLLSC